MVTLDLHVISVAPDFAGVVKGKAPDGVLVFLAVVINQIYPSVMNRRARMALADLQGPEDFEPVRRPCARCRPRIVNDVRAICAAELRPTACDDRCFPRT